mmetsp:Transcript_2313/g.5825  ORF Transcript_2313/g.5825 Transcript_2313/m.5825 type:complete len:173 (-) Transcript_2313:49-567(-)
MVEKADSDGLAKEIERLEKELSACYEQLPTALQSEKFENMNSFLPLLGSILSDLDEHGPLGGGRESRAEASGAGCRKAQTSWAALEGIQKSAGRQDRRRQFTQAAEHALREIEEEIAADAPEPALFASPPHRQPIVTNKLVATQLRRCAHCDRLMVSAFVESHLRFCCKKSE